LHQFQRQAFRQAMLDGKPQMVQGAKPRTPSQAIRLRMVHGVRVSIKPARTLMGRTMAWRNFWSAVVASRPVHGVCPWAGAAYYFPGAQSVRETTDGAALQDSIKMLQRGKGKAGRLLKIE
jgi:hypothetical protein